MKIALLLTLPFLLFAFFTNLPLAFSEQVLDIYGKPITPGDDYLISPAFFGPSGGGLKLIQTENSDCPVTVLQSSLQFVRGDPVKITIPGTSSGNITTDIPVEIEFSKKPECASSSKWSLVWGSGYPPPFVGIGDAEDHPGHLLAKGTFKIQKFQIGYTLSFCGDFLPTCSNIGRFNAETGENGFRLVITEKVPFVFLFFPASEEPDSVFKSVTGM